MQDKTRSQTMPMWRFSHLGRCIGVCNIYVHENPFVCFHPLVNRHQRGLWRGNEAEAMWLEATKHLKVCIGHATTCIWYCALIVECNDRPGGPASTVPCNLCTTATCAAAGMCRSCPAGCNNNPCCSRHCSARRRRMGAASTGAAGNPKQSCKTGWALLCGDVAM